MAPCRRDSDPSPPDVDIWEPRHLSADDRSEPAALRPPADAANAVAVDTPSVYGFRRGALSYVVTFEPKYTHVDITKNCLPSVP